MRSTGDILKKGSIYLTELPFTDQKKSKIRPVVVLHHDVIYDDVIVMAISSVISRRPGQNTILVSASDNSFKETGLKKESIILTNRIVTLNRRRLFHLLGRFSNQYLDEIDRNIVNIFQIGITQTTNQTNQTDNNKFIPYGRQTIDDDDVYSVVKILRSDWLTTGPKVQEFEQAIADYVGTKHAVAVSSGTAALHSAMFALGIRPGDEVIVPPMTFAATANCILYQGGTPIFADVDPETLLIDPKQVETKITPHTRAIISVDYAGQPCDWDALREIADRHNLHLVDDGCHALGATYKGERIGTLADLTVFSFHPVKHITTGEGGMVVTDDEGYAERMRVFRTHGITRDSSNFVNQPSAISHQPVYPLWYYEMIDLGYNYRITDIQCALGLSQLAKLPEFLQRRREIAALYDEALANIPGIYPLGLRADVLPASQSAERKAQRERKEALPSDSTPCSKPSACSVEFTEGDDVAYSTGALCSLHSYHLYVVRLDPEGDRSRVFRELRNSGIGVNVHYIPVYLHPFYRDHLGMRPGLCPAAESAHARLLSLPMFPGMTDDDVEKVIKDLKKVM